MVYQIMLSSVHYKVRIIEERILLYNIYAYTVLVLISPELSTTTYEHSGSKCEKYILVCIQLII